MTYFFSGVIAPFADEACLRDLVGQFGGRYRALPRPMAGHVLAFAADYESPVSSPRLDDALVRWSATYPAQSFVRLEVECFGGACDQSGFAFRSGTIISRATDETGGARPTPLEALCAASGLDLSGPSFAPFQRGWFPPARPGSQDITLMRIALEASREGIGRVAPNPSVGCVLYRDDGAHGGSILAEARTGDGGRPHAEEIAIEEAGDEAHGAIAYVTLEPCAQRSTGAMSCSERLVAAKVARVVIAAADPHPFAAGAGLARLRAAGIAVTTGVLEAEATALNADFFAQIPRQPG